MDSADSDLRSEEAGIKKILEFQDYTDRFLTAVKAIIQQCSNVDLGREDRVQRLEEAQASLSNLSDRLRQETCLLPAHEQQYHIAVCSSTLRDLKKLLIAHAVNQVTYGGDPNCPRHAKS